MCQGNNEVQLRTNTSEYVHIWLANEIHTLLRRSAFSGFICGGADAMSKL